MPRLPALGSSVTWRGGQRRFRRVRRAVLLAGCGVAMVAACTTPGSPNTGPTGATSSGDGGARPPAGPSLTWSRLALPPGVEPLTVAPLGDLLLLGAATPRATSPGATGWPTPGAPLLMTVAADGTVTTVPLGPHSPYAAEARWTSVTTQGAHILAIGGARGGAHANVRWTVWTGSAAALEEKPQSFSTFGGWGAGDLVDAVITSTGNALIGTWGGAKAGLDAAVWLPSGDVWTRQDPAGTGLESTRELLVGPRSAVAAGHGILVAGSALHLGKGSVGQLAAVWRSSDRNAGWSRIDLPDAGQHSEAVSARCDDRACTVAGHVDGALARWQVEGEHRTRDNALPRIAVADNDKVPAPLVVAGRDVQLSSEGGQLVTLSREGAGWSRSTGPAGIPVAATVAGNRVYVLLSTGPGVPATLWRADAGAWG